MKVPFFGKDRYYTEYRDSIHDIVDEVYSTGQVVQGPEVSEFEEKIAKYCDRRFAVAVGSCTDALHFSLLDAGVGVGDEVLLTGYSFIASATAIPKVGAVPVFVDITNDDYMMDFEDLENKITDETKAVVGVHLFGDVLNIGWLEDICNSKDLILIEDAAQSIGGSCYGKNSGGMGKYSCISFDPTKILSAQANGGVILTDDEETYKRLCMLRYHGKNPKTGDFELLGYNSRISSLQAKLLGFNLDHLDGWIERNKAIAEKYMSGLEDIDDIISLPQEFSGVYHVYHKFVIQAAKRDELKKFLSENGIQTNIHYVKGLHEQPLFSNCEHRAEDLETIDEVKTQVLSLPIHAWLKDSEVDYVIDKVREFYDKC